MASNKVLVVDDTKLINRMIRDKLVASGYSVEDAYNGPEAIAKLKTFKPDLIILDVMMPGMDGYQVARRVRQDPAAGHVPIIMLTAKAGISEKVAGFEAGADDYLTKPFDPTELELHVRALITRAQTQPPAGGEKPPGKIISVFSLRGGSGSTSIAVNLATVLAQLYEEDVSIVDLSLEAASVSLMLDLIPRLTLANLSREEDAANSALQAENEQVGRHLSFYASAALSHAGDAWESEIEKQKRQAQARLSEVKKIDEDLLKGYMPRHPSGVRLLAAPASPVLAEFVTPKLVQTVLPLLRSSYTHTIIDMAHQLNELNLAAFDLSDQIVVVLTPDMLSLKSTTTILETFRSLGYPAERVTLVLNWTFPKRGLYQKDIEAALGRPISLVLPYESEGLVRAINEGSPITLNQTTSLWTNEVERLAYLISAPIARGRADLEPTKRYTQLKRRMNSPA